MISTTMAVWTPEGMGKNRQLLELRVKLIDRYGAWDDVPATLVDTWYDRAEEVAEQHLLVIDNESEWAAMQAEWAANVEAD
jgi:hypothetical protein